MSDERDRLEQAKATAQKAAAARVKELEAKHESAGAALYAGLCRAAIERILAGPEKWVDQPHDIMLRLESYIRRAEALEAAEAENEALRAERDAEKARAAELEALLQQVNAAYVEMRAAGDGPSTHAMNLAEKLRKSGAENEALRADRERGLRIAHELTLETQTVEEACTSLVDLVRKARAERDRLKEDRQRIIEALGAVHCPECEAVFMVTVPALASGEESR